MMKAISLFIRIIFILFFILSTSSCHKSSKNEELHINYEKYVLQNGLQVILHTDHSDPIISCNIMYHVGSSRELPGKTGFAHLFEHFLFGGSENVPLGKFDKIIEDVGGMNNGFTNRDITTYFERFPKNALEKILWLESDRMGFFINSVSQHEFATQQNVVQNEKRQYIDNSPYGFTYPVLHKNLYPQNHPYNWEVIGEMADLTSATLKDVQKYYEQFYGPNNATLILAGDFNTDSVKLLINKYFGEIKSHGEVTSRTAMPVSLEKTIKLYHEDNFANVPEITMAWPVPEAFSKDSYALDFLTRILSEGKKTPLYKVLIKEKKLTSQVIAYINTNELSGELIIQIRANEGKSLQDIEASVFEAFSRFEKEGITEKHMESVKALSEKTFYETFQDVLGKSILLGYYNTLLNDPGFMEKEIQKIKAVTITDVKMAYEKYIKGKPHVVTSFVPKGKTRWMAVNSIPANVKEENITEASQVVIDHKSDIINIAKTSSLIDRMKEPNLSKEPEVTVPSIWKAKLSNGIEVYGIQNKELPLVSINFTIEGGVSQDNIQLPGVSNMVANVLPQGTQKRTPEELEEVIKILGSVINVKAEREELVINANTLSRNFDKTVSLMKEILLEPRWDSLEFSIAQSRVRNSIIQSEADPNSVARNLFFKLAYGKDHIFGYNTLGTRESIDKINIDDLKTYYKKNISPSVTKIHIAGDISKEQALSVLKSLEKDWKSKEVTIKNSPVLPNPEKSQIYFVNIPGSKQSVIYIGYLAISRDNPDFVPADFINYRLGGAFTSVLNQILREEKGYTYGAQSSFMEQRTKAPFLISTSVRSDATFESVKIFKDEMEKYRNGVTKEELQFIKNCKIRSNALRFETNDALLNMLFTLRKYGFTDDYLKKEQEVMRDMTLDKHRKITEKYIVPDKMYYVVVGDAATQLNPLEKIGFGKPILVNQ